MKAIAHSVVKLLVTSKANRKQLIFLKNTKFKIQFLRLLWNYNYLRGILVLTSLKICVFIKYNFEITTDLNMKSLQYKLQIKHKDIWALHIKEPQLNIIYSTLKGIKILNGSSFSKKGGYIIY